MTTGRSGVGSQTSLTALQTSAANSSSVPVNDSGRVLEADEGVAHRLGQLAAQARALQRDVGDAIRSRPKTTRRCSVDVEL